MEDIGRGQTRVHLIDFQLIFCPRSFAFKKRFLLASKWSAGCQISFRKRQPCTIWKLLPKITFLERLVSCLYQLGSFFTANYNSIILPHCGGENDPETRCLFSSPVGVVLINSHNRFANFSFLILLVSYPVTWCSEFHPWEFISHLTLELSLSCSTSSVSLFPPFFWDLTPSQRRGLRARIS